MPFRNIDGEPCISLIKMTKHSLFQRVVRTGSILKGDITLTSFSVLFMDLRAHDQSYPRVFRQQ